MKNYYRLFISSSLILYSLSSFSQDITNMPPETPDDPYIFVDRSSMQRSAPYIRTGTNFYTAQVLSLIHI